MPGMACLGREVLAGSLQGQEPRAAGPAPSHIFPTAQGGFVGFGALTAAWQCSTLPPSPACPGQALDPATLLSPNVRPAWGVQLVAPTCGAVGMGVWGCKQHGPIPQEPTSHCFLSTSPSGITCSCQSSAHLSLPFFFLLAGFQNGGATVNGDVFQVRPQPLALAP